MAAKEQHAGDYFTATEVTTNLSTTVEMYGLVDRNNVSA